MEYGVYALIFGAALFVNNLFYALVTYPLSIRGAVADEAELRRLTLQALGVGSIILIPLGAVIVVATALAGRIELGIPALIAIVLWQLQETLRRALLARLQHGQAAIGDTVSYLGQAALLWIVGLYTGLSPVVAFIAMAITSAISVLIQAAQLGLRVQRPVAILSALDQAWRTARWLLMSQVVNGLGFQALPWALALSRGTAETAAFQAALNIVNVTNPLTFSVANLLLPAAARAASEDGLQGAYRTGLRLIAQGGVVLVPFFVVLAVFPEWVLSVVYGPASPYVAIGNPLRLFAIAYTLYYIGGLLITLLTSLEETRKVFVSQLASALGGIVIGIPVTIWLGLTGACIGVFSIHCIRACVVGLLLLRLRPPTPVQGRAVEVSD
jgi:O-antigen/teichoic acid export membrane protein